MNTHILPDSIREGAKSILTLVGSIITTVIAVGVDGPEARYLALASAIITAVVVWLTPNAETDEQMRVRLAGERALEKREQRLAGIVPETYEEAGGVEFPETPVSEDAEFPDTDTLYQPGEVEGERFTVVTTDGAGHEETYDVTVHDEPRHRA